MSLYGHKSQVRCCLLSEFVKAWPSTVLKQVLAAADASTLEECTNLLHYGTVFYRELDAVDQRAALMSLYHRTGGPHWTPQLARAEDREQFQLLVQELEDAGYDLADQALNISALPSDVVVDLASLPALSENCALQQWLSFGQSLLKYQWGSNVSYCHWYGISCCKTAVSARQHAL